jgi:hypothetical protein
MLQSRVNIRVARWFIFKPKIPIWVIFRALGMEMFGLVFGHLEYIVASWYILLSFGNIGIFSPVLV